MDNWLEIIPEDIRNKFEFYNFNHAAEILRSAFPAHWKEIVAALRGFVLSEDDIIAGGGSESAIPKKLSAFLRPAGWEEMRITGDLFVKLHGRHGLELGENVIRNFIDSHNIDYVKGEVAVDLEWNSKDQTFDRDLYAFRMFYECGVIACGVIVTRSESMNPVFTRLGIMKKYGASTTWMGKLLPRIHSRRHGGCPLLVVGITPRAMADERRGEGVSA